MIESVCLVLNLANSFWRETMRDFLLDRMQWSGQHFYASGDRYTWDCGLLQIDQNLAFLLV